MGQKKTAGMSELNFMENLLRVEVGVLNRTIDNLVDHMPINPEAKGNAFCPEQFRWCDSDMVLKELAGEARCRRCWRRWAIRKAEIDAGIVVKGEGH